MVVGVPSKLLLAVRLCVFQRWPASYSNPAFGTQPEISRAERVLSAKKRRFGTKERPTSNIDVSATSAEELEKVSEKAWDGRGGGVWKSQIQKAL